MNDNNILYRVYDKKGRYQQTYSPKLKDSRSWAVDCATLLKGYVQEDLINNHGLTEESKKIFDFQKKESEN